MNKSMRIGHLPAVVTVMMLAVTVLTPCPAVTRADDQIRALELGSPFVDNAILQRDMPVPVWGWARPGSKVSVTFGAQTQTAAADVRGKWRVKLDPLKASFEERELTVTTPGG